MLNKMFNNNLIIYYSWSVFSIKLTHACAVLSFMIELCNRVKFTELTSSIGVDTIHRVPDVLTVYPG